MNHKTIVILFLSLCAFTLIADAAPRGDTSAGNAVAQATCTLANNGSAGYQAWSIAVFSGGTGDSCSDGPAESATACMELLVRLQSTGMVISSVTGGAFTDAGGLSIVVTTYTLGGSADAGAALIDAAVSEGGCERPVPPL